MFIRNRHRHIHACTCMCTYLIYGWIIDSEHSQTKLWLHLPLLLLLCFGTSCPSLEESPDSLAVATTTTWLPEWENTHMQMHIVKMFLHAVLNRWQEYKYTVSCHNSKQLYVKTVCRCYNFFVNNHNDTLWACDHTIINTSNTHD